MHSKISRYLRYLIFSFTVLAIGTMSFAIAQDLVEKKQVPGYYRMKHGQFEVTVLFDGAFEIDTGLLLNATKNEIQQILASNYIDGNKVQTAVNVYLINTGKNLVLIDVGCGTLFGPKMGRVMANLKAAGYTPEQVDTIVFTHMHGDHVGGLVDANGKALFPNAKVYANKLESDFWLSEKNAKAAKTEMAKNLFKMAQDSTAPYRDANRWYTFEHKEEVVPGITAYSLIGHTPGHTIFRIMSGEERFFVLGDIAHSYAVQFSRPDVAIEFDSDPKQAVISRYKAFNLAAKYKWKVAGAHLPYPGVGQIRSNGDGTYEWLPIQFIPN